MHWNKGRRRPKQRSEPVTFLSLTNFASNLPAGFDIQYNRNEVPLGTNTALNLNRQSVRPSTMHKWVSVVCLFLVLVTAGAQVLHSHDLTTGPKNSRESGSSCQVCATVHLTSVASNATEITTVRYTADIISSSDLTPKSKLRAFRPYVRPPPAT